MAISTHEFTIEHDGIEYMFRAPSFADEATLGILERGIRRDIERKAGITNPTGDPYGLDDHSYVMIRAVAIFQTLLKSCSDMWPFKKGPAGEYLGVDYNEWGSEHIETAIAVYFLYTEQVLRFRERRNKPAAGGSPLAGGANPEQKPV